MRISGMKADLKKKPENTGPSPVTPEGTYGMPPPPGTVQTPTTGDTSQPQGLNLLALTVWVVSHAKDQGTARQLEIAAAAAGGVHVSAGEDRAAGKVVDGMGG